jgi:hypothetical protein
MGSSILTGPRPPGAFPELTAVDCTLGSTFAHPDPGVPCCPYETRTEGNGDGNMGNGLALCPCHRALCCGSAASGVGQARRRTALSQRAVL